MTTRQASREGKRPAPSKRHFCAAAATAYRAPVGEEALAPPMPRMPRPGYAWDSEGREVKLMQGRRWLRRQDDEEETE